MGFDVSVYEVTVIPAIIVVLFVLKKVGIPPHYLPIASVFLGVLLCASLEGFTVDSILSGLIIGGLAVGVHSGTKNTIQKYVQGETDKE